MDRSDDEEALRELLSVPRRIAVLGASPDPDRDSHRIFVFLKNQGHDVLPINPVAPEVAGVATAADLQEAAKRWGQPPEVVDVFRSPDHLPGIVEQTLAVGAPWLWCQFGVVNDEATKMALDGGLEVVVDRCILVETRRLVR